MRPVSSRLDVVLRTVDGANVSSRTVVGIPPSDADPISDEMRVAIGSTIILRAFDPGEPIVTGAPIAYVTKGGDAYVTKTGDPYVTKVIM